MRVFNYSAIRERKWDSEILGLVAAIYKEAGKQELYLKQRPEELEKLVEIAKVLDVVTEAANGHAIILLDEPTTGLDFRECVKVMDVVRELNENGTTVIMVCHDMEVVGDFARRVIAMTAGRVVADGPTFEVLRDGRVLKEAHILPPQVTEVSLILGREAACPAAVAEANTVAQMVAAVAQACDREVEDVEVEAID